MHDHKHACCCSNSSISGFVLFLQFGLGKPLDPFLQKGSI